MNKLVEWFNTRTAQERKVLTVGGIIIASILFYLLLWKPVIGKMQNVNRMLTIEKNNLAWMQENVPNILRLKGGAGSRADLSRLSNQAAVSHQLSMKSFQPQGANEAQVVFEKASFNKVLAWLHTMEQKNSLTLSKVNITETGQKNIVDARINISKGK